VKHTRTAPRFRWEFHEKKDHRASAVCFRRGKHVGGASRYWALVGGLRWAAYVEGRAVGRRFRTLAKAKRWVEAMVKGTSK